MQSGTKYIVVFNIYFPYFESSAEISFYLGFMENILNTVAYDDIILIGDTNFSIDEGSAGFQLLKSFIQSYNILACDDLITCSDKCTYVNTALEHVSCIDHCLLTPNLRRVVNNVSILDSGANHSDCHPLCISLDFNCSKVNCDKRKPMFKIRLDKGSLPDYYALTGEALQAFNFGCTCLKCDLGCSYRLNMLSISITIIAI